MCDDIFEQKNMFLDHVLAERRSYRMFKGEVPPKDDIHRILHAGLLAPFAAAAIGTPQDYFRRFFVMTIGSKSMKSVIPLVMNEVNTMADDIDQKMEKSPELRAQAISFVQRLGRIKQLGTVPGIGTAPYYIIVAERRGFPSIGLQSLAHCMENMWLKATALELGFQLVSITSQMSDNPEFCRILGIAMGEWDLMGCAVGYPQEELSPSIRPPVDTLTRWLE
ncbi:MAG: nitroreductase family protein [Methanoregula sp.]|jgi:nitroreductase|nr:nitroreductase family protein [Methanoregula sp.]